ncbi:DMT family transporter [Lacticaseibacillus pabuli]|uniref:DMT family transporter n=1 Tax=Lacticaseibacillus pabuli TaxID=3025672 RepID=A0ABY7WR15_9LACO|nr:DMT family transporter [Lacticaseibacillus sp. KACC 23028]WDF82634.1 DMT family transporter [Lacticaseibacillus sp. KACC 23028]
MNKQTKQRATRAVLGASIGACMWGVGGFCSNILFKTTAISPSWLVSVRLTVAGLLMLIFARISGIPIFDIWKHKGKRLRLIAFGLGGVFAAQLTYMLAIYYGNAAIATIMLSLVPGMITVLIAVRTRAVPRLIDTVAVIAALLGVFFLVTDGNVAHLHVAPLALFWGLGAALTGVAYTLLPRPLLNDDSPLVVVGWGLLVGSVAGNLVEPIWHVPSGVRPIGWFALAFIVLGGTFLSYALYVSSLKTIRPATAGMVGNFEPLTATTLSVIFLNLDFHFLQFAGIVIVLLAVLMMGWQPKSKRNQIQQRLRGE